MARGQQLAPRRAPRQARSRDTRDRVLEAAARVFAAHGYAAGTTNRIAAAARLSIGSLYQYFPNKDAILVELMRRHVAEGVGHVQRLLLDGGGLPSALEDKVRLFVDAALANHAGNPRLHQVLFEEAPRPPELLAELHELERSTVQTVEALLRADPEVRVADPAVAAHLLVAGIESLAHRFVASPLASEDASRFAAEMTALFVRYLRG